MKYITHMSSSQEDDKHVAVMEAAGGGKEGWAIYGIYWAVAEKIAAQIRPEQIVTWTTKPWSKWASDLGTKAQYARSALSLLADCGLINLYMNDKTACVNMPNLLKYGDEYLKTIMRKSGETPESIGRKFVAPAGLLSYRNKKDLKDLRQPVDNSVVPPLTGGANDGGNAEGHPPVAPPPGPKGNDVHPRIRALNLPPEKEQAVAELYQRHQAERIRGDDISDSLRGAGLDHSEVIRMAALFIG